MSDRPDPDALMDAIDAATADFRPQWDIEFFRHVVNVWLDGGDPLAVVMSDEERGSNE